MQPPPLPLVCVCAPKGLHPLLQETLECGRTASRSRRQRLSYVLCDSDETHAHRGATPKEGSEEAPREEPKTPYSTNQLDIFESLGFPKGELHSQQDQAEADTSQPEKCVSARVLFPVDAPGLLRREKGPQRKKIVAIDQLVNKGFLKHDWMQRMRTERPSCLILCFDLRKVYEAEPCCCAAGSGSASTPRSAASSDDARTGQSSSVGVVSPSSATSNGGPRAPAERRWGPQEEDIAAAEAEAMAAIEFFRDRLQRRLVIPKMIVFVILPAGMEDPQSAVGFLKRLNPADIAAIFITCGVDDLKTKLEKLEQVSFECSVEYYENEARRYRKQTQVTFKGDRSQTSAFHVYQTRCLIKAGYMLEFAQQPHAAMKSYITAWQFLTTYAQMAQALERMTVCNLISVRMYPMYFKANEPAKAAHHAREHRAVLRENIPESPLQGYLLPLWLAQLHQLLAHLCEEALQANPSALDTRDVWQLAGFHYQAAARYLQHVRSWIKTAKTVNPPPSMKGGLCVPSPWLGRPDSLQHGVSAFATSNPQDLAAAAAAAQEEVFLRFIFFFNEAQVLTLASHLLSKAHIAYKLVRGYRSCPVLACELADAMFDGRRMMTARQLYFTLATAFASYTYGSQEDDGAAALAPLAGAAAASRLTETTDTDMPGFAPTHFGSSGDSQAFLETQPTIATQDWWPLYRYVLARLTLCISYLLGVPPADFLYEIARVDPRFSAMIGEQAAAGQQSEGRLYDSLPPATPSSAVCSAEPPRAPSDEAVTENCHVALKAAFEMLNLLALREDREDPDGSKRKQMHEFILTLFPRLNRLQVPRNQQGFVLYVELHAVVVWTAFGSELHLEPSLLGNGRHPGSDNKDHQAGAAGTASSDLLLVGTLCYQHSLGFDLAVLSAAELVTSFGKKASCVLKASMDTGQRLPPAGEGEPSGHSQPASVLLVHGALSSCQLMVDRQAMREISGSKLHCLHLWWAECPRVCFQLATLCCLDSEASVHFKGAAEPLPVPCGRWPPPLRRVLLLHKLYVPPPPLWEIGCSKLAKPFLPSLSLSKDTFKLASVGLSYSKHLWIGELAPYIVQLTVREAKAFPRLTVWLQCTAHELKAATEPTQEAGRLLEDEFEAFAIDSVDAEKKDLLTSISKACMGTHVPGDLQNEGPRDQLLRPRLLRVSASKAARMSLVLRKTHVDAELDHQASESSSAGGPAVVPFVFDLREQHSLLLDAERASALVEVDASVDSSVTSFSASPLNSDQESKVVCLPLLIRLQRAGTFQVRVTLDVEVDEVAQRLTAASAVECQRALQLFSSLVSLPLVCTGEARAARCLTLTNVSKIPLQLSTAKLTSAEEQGGSPDSPGTPPDHHQSLMTSGLPCILLSNESWSCIMKLKPSKHQTALLLKYNRTAEHLPFPFRCMDVGITDNLTLAHLPSLVKPVAQQYLDISVTHPISSSVGEPFIFSAALKNQTWSAMELVVCLTYPHGSGSNTRDPPGQNSMTISADCPFMVSGQLQTQIIILPQSTKPLHWTLVPSRPGSFELPTVWVEATAKEQAPALAVGAPVTGTTGEHEGPTTWKCASDPVHVVVFSKA
ncbi:hypothetical protein Esti_004054 [Eimeria stiedai]